jgi:uncharacterized protein
MLVAFSGGVDSSFLAAVAAQELGDRALAVTVKSPVQPAGERDAAEHAAAAIGIRHRIIEVDSLDSDYFTANSPDRCYRCKLDLFQRLRSIAREEGLDIVADGTTLDDLNDYRPGRRALSELGVLSPLLEAGVTKDDIRAWSRTMGLPSADKPSMACLASRIPYGTPITAERLAAVDAVEEFLRAHGIAQVRARHHGNVVRIEVPVPEIGKIAAPGLREMLVAEAKRAGFTYVALDLEGYRTGSLNAGVNGAGKDKN